MESVQLSIKMNKNGMSSIVATVLIILITISAAAFFASFVVPFIREKIYSSTECLDYNDYYKFEDSSGYVCRNSTGAHGFMISSKSDEGLKGEVLGFEIYLTANGSAVSERFMNGSASTVGKRMLNQTKTNITIPRDGNSYTYVYTDSSKNYTKAKISAVIKGSGGNAKTCDYSDFVEFIPCSVALNV